ncbi:hypothetical protein [Microvirga solisilvae]|uniref:hypothetical protein n=1 Tax=Microvirga solisilvae TaxID=2919498 RepID=UPI001FAFEA27|nr:hypothetical protein [Microvirga solisilvae]
MTTRFEKALAQVAGFDHELKVERMDLETRAQKIRRLEELIRAKEATGDRIVISIAAALVVSAMALPVYAAYYSNSHAYLPSIGGSISSATSLVAERLPNLGRSMESVSERSAPDSDPARTEPGAKRRPRASETSLARYVIHRATEASALIEGPSGLWWVTPGMKIPGAGQILSIERSEAGWAVVTSETTITEETSVVR